MIGLDTNIVIRHLMQRQKSIQACRRSHRVSDIAYKIDLHNADCSLRGCLGIKLTLPAQKREDKPVFRPAVAR